MDCKTFLKQEASNLVVKYPEMSIQYAFDQFDNDHFFIIDPPEIYKKIVANDAMGICRWVRTNHPTESISFSDKEGNLDLEFDEIIFEYNI